MTTEQLTALARAYAVKQAESSAEYLSAWQGFHHGYYAGVEQMQSEAERLRAALAALIDAFERVEPLYSGDKAAIEKAKAALKNN